MAGAAPCATIPRVLRRLLRLVVFEHFPVATGLGFGFALAALAAWAFALAAGPAAVPWCALAAAGAALALVNGWLVPRLGAPRHRGSLAGRLAAGYVGLAFATIVVAASVVGLAAALVALSGLLAFVGLSPAHGFTAFRYASVATALASAGALAWAAWAGRVSLEVSERRLALPGLAPALAGLRIAHLSDLHVGNGLDGAALSALVERVCALEPDLVVLTGDLFDYDPDAVPDGARRLGALRARLGVFAVLGNHDALVGRERVARCLAEHAPALRLLRGEWQALAAGAPLYVAGFDDPGHDWSLHGGELPELAALARSLPRDGPTLLLAHRPEAFVQAAEAGIAVVLAGHYHGGQIAVPGAAERWNVAHLFSDFPNGAYRLRDSHLYVSRGIGFAGPRVRIGSHPELALLTLEAA
jgi:predicted MPP superfamily phosphohydrolase